MEHRKFTSSSRMSMNQSHDRNHSTAEQSYNHMGVAVAGPLVYSTDNVSRGIVNSASQWNSESRANVYASSSFSVEVPHLQPPYPVPSYHPFPQSSAAGNMYLGPQYNVDHAHTNYTDSRNIHEDETCLLDFATGSRRGQLKRQSPGISVACERGSSSRFFSPGSSSSSSELQLENPPSGYQNILSGRIGLPHYAGGSLPIGGEDSPRNVRSRTRLDLDTTPVRIHIPSYSFHHYHATTNLSSYRGAVDPTNIDSDATTHEWSFNSLLSPAHGMSRNSGIMNGLIHGRNQVLTRGNGTGTGGCHSNCVRSRNLVPPSRYLHASPIWGAREGRDSHSQRAIPSYRTALSYPRFGREAVSTENGLQSISETLSSRYSRPSTGGWQNSYRNGRLRIDIERFQSGSSIVDTHDRTGSEDLMMMDRSSLYASSRISFDQYGDMRLDIDNMGYEDLLLLGERIGNVNTGLTEDMISKCLTETKKSSEQNDVEGNCCICLEEYGNGDEVGSLKKCGHDYHVSCIRKWLLVKNACPICKASVLTECSEEE